MKRYRVLVTDLTVYGGDQRCVAGINLDNTSMVRPEPEPAEFWPADMCAPKGPFAPGNVVEFEGLRPEPPTDFPHMTEDMVVRGAPLTKGSFGPEKFSDALEKLHTPLERIFGQHVQFANGKPYFEKGTKCPSLYGTNVEFSAIRFHESSYENKPPKPRVVLELPEGTANLSITALDLRERYRASGVDGLTNLFKSAKLLHLRLGLARAWEDFPDRCYMQINGIYVIK